MNRRGFFSTTLGALILGPVTRMTPWREFTNIRPLWLSVDMAEPTADVVGMTSDIDLSVIDFEPLIESFKKLELNCNRTGMGFDLIRKDILASPCFTEIEDEDGH